MVLRTAQEREEGEGGERGEGERGERGEREAEVMHVFMAVIVQANAVV